MLTQRLRDAVARLNPNDPRRIAGGSRSKGTHSKLSLIGPKQQDTFHLMLVDGVEVEYRDTDGVMRGGRVQLVDFESS